MSFFLRIIGTTNAAVWFGAAVFLLVGVWPAFGSAEMLKILPALHAEGAGYIALERYFMLQLWCGTLALVHLFLETLYAGRPLRRWLLALAAGLFVLAVISSLMVGPRLKRLHLERYGVRSTPQQRQQAAAGLRMWRGIVLVTQILVVMGSWVYILELNTAGTGARLVGAGKFRG